MLHFEPVKSYRSTLTADSSAHSPDDVELPQQSRSPHLRLNMAFISDQERMSLSDSQSISEDRSISAISRRDHNRNLCHFREELSDVEQWPNLKEDNFFKNKGATAEEEEDKLETIGGRFRKRKLIQKMALLTIKGDKEKNRVKEHSYHLRSSAKIQDELSESEQFEGLIEMMTPDSRKKICK